jgi:alpha-tubulin suppressor-like RCC1 family protein
LAQSLRTVFRLAVLSALAVACVRNAPTDPIELRVGAANEPPPATGVGGMGGAAPAGAGGSSLLPLGSAGFGGLPLVAPAAVDVTAGGRHSCALLDNGHVACWGQADLGDGVSTTSSAAVMVTGLSDAVAISAGWFHTCARRQTGAVVCWGTGSSGQLGSGSSARAIVPVTVAGLSDAVALAAGSLHTCAVRAGGGVVCWGDNQFGQLGEGGMVGQALSPVSVLNLSDATSVTAGRWHTCAVRSTGAVVCWGSGQFGHLGNGGFDNSAVPVPVSGLFDAESLGAGWDHTCAVRATGDVVCWGSNSNGQLGNGSTDFNGIPQPVAAAGLAGATAVVGGAFHTCALRSGGDVACWGDGSDNQLGNGESSYPSPLLVPRLQEATAIAAGDNHTCATRSSGGVVCWGYDGVEGPAPSIDSPVPAPVAGLPDMFCSEMASALPCAFTEVPAGDDVVSSVGGTITFVGGIQLQFPQVTVMGEAAALGSGVGTPPPGSFAILGAGQPLSSLHYWTIASNASIVGPVVVCIHYDSTWIIGDPASAQLIQMVDDGGHGFLALPSAVNVEGQVVCGRVDTLPSSLTPEVRAPQSCSGPGDCATGFCVDGVCCDDACGGGDPTDCLACSTAAGGTADGSCTALPAATPCADDGNVCTQDLCDSAAICQHLPGNAGTQCRAATPGGCDLAAACDGSAAACPANTIKASGSSCTDDGNLCTQDLCDGARPSCQHQSLPACTAAVLSLPQASDEPPVVFGGPDLAYFSANEGTLLLDFGDIATAGTVTVVQAGSGPTPSDEFSLVPSSPATAVYWDIETTAAFAPPIVICIHYKQSWIGVGQDESSLEIAHFSHDGSAFTALQPPPPALGYPTLDQSGNFICGQTDTLSPFALVVRRDTTGPIFDPQPADVNALATSTSGAVVSYPTPPAVDAVSGPAAVWCTPASGSQFSLGPTTVRCIATDADGNSSRASFQVNVQYAWSGILQPVDADGQSVFKLGSTVPVKFRLTDVSAAITNAIAKLTLAKVSATVTGGDVEAISTSAATSGNLFRYDTGQYIFNLSTKSLAVGTWRLSIDLGDGASRAVPISLR